MADAGSAAASPTSPLTGPAPLDHATSDAAVAEPITFAPLTLTADAVETPAPTAVSSADVQHVPTPAPPVVKLAPLRPIVPAIGDVEPVEPVERDEPSSIGDASVPATGAIAGAAVVASVTAPAAVPTADPTNEPAAEPTNEPAADPTNEPVSEPAAGTPADAPAGAVAEAVSTELPQIVEATPPPVQVDELMADPTGVAAAPTGPRLPSGHQPDQRNVAVPSDVAVMAMPAPAKPKRKRSRRRGLKLLFALVVLAGLIAAGVFYGREYLIPAEWDATTEPYAVAVEEVRGVAYVEPIALIGEPTADYTSLLGAELTGDWSAEEPMWRALGLLSGETTEASVATVLAGWQDAIYSTSDGQVYRDAGQSGAEQDARITEEMTAASLDQEYGWSTDQPGRTLDDAAQTLAAVKREARAVQRSSPFAAEITPPPPAAAVFVPPVLGYRTLAPLAFSEFPDPDGASSLDGIGSGGPGPLPTDGRVLAPDASLASGDVATGTPTAMDRSFWYLVFAGYLDAGSAYRASEAVVENSVTIAERGGARCVYATFAGGDVAQTATLRSALETWSASVPAEFASSFSVLGDGSLQLVSCDPGAGFENLSRLGVARELVAWRIAELATIEAVAASDAELGPAWAAVEAANIGVELASLPGDTPLAEVAEATRAAVGAVLGPAG